MSRTAKRLILNFGGAAAFSPLTISGLWGWWDASDLTTLFQDSAGSTPVTATSDPVGRLADKSGNGRHFLQAGAGTLKPTYAGTGNGITFDGGDYLTIGSLATTFTAQTVIAVFKPTATGAYDRVFTEWTVAHDYQNVTDRHIPILRNINNQSFGSWLTSGLGSTLSTTNSTKYLWVSRHTGSALQNRANGVDASSVSHTLNHAPANMRIGASNAPDSYFTGALYELFVFSTALSTTDRAALETYLNAKWTIY